MEDALRKKLFRTGIGLIAGGAGLQLLGLAGMVGFFLKYTGGRLHTATAEQLARAATLPHVAIVVGLGLAVFGAVLLFRSRRLHSVD